jgi:hypothetical protein
MGRRHLKVTSHPDEKRLRARHKAAEHRSASLVNLHLVSPPLSGAHFGKSVYNLTASVLTALERNWRKKLLGATSDGSSNVTCYSSWQSRLTNSAR